MRLIKVFMFTIATGLAANGVGLGLASAAGTVPEAHPIVVIKFGPGSARITEDDKAALRSAVREVLQKHLVEHVTVAAWSDKALPAKGKLNETDRGLAEERLNVVNEFLQSDMEIGDVDTFNMAESANWLARTFHTKDAELKSIFTRAEDAPVKRSEFRALRSRGGPSSAVVVVVRAPE
jgi:hypothetical protein